MIAVNDNVASPLAAARLRVAITHEACASADATPSELSML